MAIKSIRLENFKGFKNVKLDLKPLTVLLGPNSSGKSSFGEALVALSKNNLSKDRVLSFSFEEDSSTNFGKYADLIHAGCEGEQVIVELETNKWALTLGFGGRISENPLAKIGELDLTYVAVQESIPSVAEVTEPSNVGDTKQIITSSLSNESTGDFRTINTLTRLNEKTWRITGGINEDCKIFF